METSIAEKVEQNAIKETWKPLHNEIVIYCAALGCQNSITIPLPIGWTGEAEVDDRCFCPAPDCQLQHKFANVHCFGCVGGWSHDCHLFDVLHNQRSLFRREQNILLKGRCPFRVNGTSMITNGHCEPYDQDKISSRDSGAAVIRGFEKDLEEKRKR